MREADEKRIVVSEGGSRSRLTTSGALRYEDLLDALTSCCKTVTTDANRTTIHKLAWELGMNQQEEACEAIMKAAEKKVPLAYPWSYYTI